jgi:hypothetical protein
MRDLLFWSVGAIVGYTYCWFRRVRRQEDAAANRRETRRILGGLHSRPLVGYPQPLSPRDFDDMALPPLREARYVEEWQPDLSGISRTERLNRWLSRPELDWALNWTARLRRAAEPVMEPPAVGTAHVRLPIEAGPGKHRAAPAYTPGDFTLDLREYGLDIREYQEVP